VRSPLDRATAYLGAALDELVRAGQVHELTGEELRRYARPVVELHRMLRRWPASP
jgi:hypothetical protein